MAGEDVLLDQVLLPFDILASIAHVNGLKNIQVLSEVEASQIITELNALAQEFDELDDSFLEDFVTDVDAELWLPHNRVAGCAARLWVGAADESNALCWPLA